VRDQLLSYYYNNYIALFWSDWLFTVTSNMLLNTPCSCYFAELRPFFCIWWCSLVLYDTF